MLALFALPAAAIGGRTMGFDEARHLLNRTSSAAGPEDIQAFAGLTREQAVDRLLAGAGMRPAGTPAPTWVHHFESPRRVRLLGEDERKAFQRAQFEKGIELRAWWRTEMLTTPSPLTEKMVLFWHNHFVSSLQKVKSPVLMYRQNLLLRKHALGSFGELLHDISKDPAMVVYLDSASNRKGQPNENFAREVMELFTLGEGNYTEKDIKEAARAFTGWGIDPDSGEFVFRGPAHDTGVKSVLGRSGNFDGDAVIDILLAQPQTAEFIVAKLWREFVSPDPDAAEIKRVARVLALTNTEQFLRQARQTGMEGSSRNPALNHILKVGQDVAQAASHLNTSPPYRTEFPNHALGQAFKAAAQVIAGKAGVAAVKVSHNGFDTHGGQQGVHARLLRELAEGLIAMRAAMQEIGRWDSTLMMTYAEFGRRPRENQSGGTDHGSASAHFVLGGRVRGGIYGLPPALTRLDGTGNPPYAVDFRSLYATALEKWWGIDSSGVLNGRYTPLDVLRT